ncbi:atpase v1 complex subunit c [Lichtheimia corymbifera JMRC:FSU:9682]|uniref:V-type proton ATPase subunit C n=1 Tax=Lichtheimia corymbifera JMRC:FSU:9682 TaxID=1263082 RepID=A0A068S3T4_9FUNG|nr:atpase v1 complex subunit c [Lichtheimia corymbifera JMRC:FSU:9682]
MKYTLVSVPALGQKQNTLLNITNKLKPFAEIHPFAIPDFKIGTLDALVLLSDELVRHDTAFEQSVNKTADVLSNLVRGQPDALVQDFLLVNDNRGPSLQETTQTLVQEMNSMDNLIKNKLNVYTQNRNTLQTLHRKQTGNYSVRNLNGVVKKEHCVLNSEYLTTLFVAVPKTAYKQWLNSYETLTSMIVPRSSVKVAEDNEYGLFSVTLFQRVVDEFTHKAREEKFVVRDFQFDEDALRKQQQELQETEEIEREQLTELIRLARTNFGEMFSAWAHLKAIRIFVESVLRYGLPPDFLSVTIAAEPKFEEKLDQILVDQYGHLGGVHGFDKQKQADTTEELLDHDLQTVNSATYRPYVQFHLEFDLERR